MRNKQYNIHYKCRVCVAQEDITTTVNSTCFPYNVKQGSPQGKLC